MMQKPTMMLCCKVKKENRLNTKIPCLKHVKYFKDRTLLSIKKVWISAMLIPTLKELTIFCPRATRDATEPGAVSIKSILFLQETL